LIPTFLVIGAMKCGTTSLCAYLRQHPEVYVPEQKDVYFFSNDNIYAKGWDWYLQQLKEGIGCKQIGEGTDNYSKIAEFPNAAKRIKRHVPHAKLLYIVRNPIQQIESAWAHMKVMNGESLPFESAIFSRNFYVDNCRYLRQINVYRELYDERSIKVIFLEDMIEDIDRVMKDVFDFLGVDSSFEINDRDPENIREGRYGDRWIVRWLKNHFETQNLFRNIPRSIRDSFRPIFKWRMKNKPVWNPDAKKQFLNIITGETKDFLTTYSKPDDFWILE